ncbi:MAG: cyclic nucleotide-binding domain-containing protein [Candidatus Lambdaproteobacteria bacterium]|nr:cyclic nucleotide-binding domain-containing protein [Candidatus Lambdaproteobacteria bacterium]
MHVLLYNDEVVRLRQRLMQYLNEIELDAAAILSISRQTEPVAYDPGEAILHQGVQEHYVYFLIIGRALIRLKTDTEERVLGDRTPVSLLGEISFFNKTPATATVEAAPDSRVLLFRLDYKVFAEIVETYPQVREVLARIGDMRLISQYNGLASYNMFMEMIGWRRDRFAINRAVMPPFELVLDTVFLPRVKETDRILEVGDGPGIVCETIAEKRPQQQQQLFIQATHLEEAIAKPFFPTPSDLTRAQYHTQTFDQLVALEVFNRMSPGRIGEQFAIAKRLLNPGAHLLLVKLRLLNIVYDDQQANSQLLFATLESLVERTWPNITMGGQLIETVFMDADLDPLMEWNRVLAQRMKAEQLSIPQSLQGEERVLLELLLDQVRSARFDPDEVLFEWLSWQGTQHGLQLEHSGHQPEIGFFYHLFRLP